MCREFTNEGQLEGAKTGVITIDLKGCEEPVLKISCNTVPKETAGLIVVKADITLVFIKRGEPLEAGLLLTPLKAEERLVEFECSGANKVVVKGKFVCHINPLKSLKLGPFIVECKQNKGAQEPSKYFESEAGPELTAQLSASLNGGAFIGYGALLEDELTFEKQIQILA